MKKIIFLLPMMTFGLSSFAEVLSPSQALERISATDIHKTKSTSTHTPELVATKEIDSAPAVYLFSTNDNKSFMIVSADDSVEPLLGYGNYDNSEINPSLQWWIDEYAAQIDWVRKHYSVSQKTGNNSTVAREPIGPLLSTTWNQNAPYNNNCPTSYSGEHYPVGCGATAMAQILNYFKYSSTSFDWAHMLNSYDGSYTTTQRNAVAKLMYECAEEARTTYSVSGSAASPTNVLKGLANLGYNQNMALAYMNNFSVGLWEDFIYNQLTGYGPVLVFGYQSSIGHAFVCDGYSSDNYFHFNWGWGGLSDGYFKLTAMTPEEQGIGGTSGGYNSNVSAIVNICPSTTAVNPNFVLTAEKIGAFVDEIGLGESFSLACLIHNRNYNSFVGSLGFELISDHTGESTYHFIKERTSIWGNSYTSNPTAAIPEDTPEGDYKFYLVWKLLDSEEWHNVIVGNYYLPNMKVSVKDGKAYFKTEIGATLSMDVVSFETPFFVKNDFSILTRIVNDGECDYDNPVFALFLAEDGVTKCAHGSNSYQILLSGESTEVEYTSDFTNYRGQTVEPGNYFLVFVDYYDREISQRYPIEIQTKPDTSNSKVEVINDGTNFVGDPEHADNKNIDIAVSLRAVDGYYIGQIWATFDDVEAPAARSASTHVLRSKTLYIPENETQVTHITGSLPELETGHSYIVSLHDNNGKLSDGIANLRFDDNVTGIEQESFGDSEIVDKKIFTISGVTVSSEEISQGIYIQRITYKDGRVITRKLLKR